MVCHGVGTISGTVGVIWEASMGYAGTKRWYKGQGLVPCWGAQAFGVAWMGAPRPLQVLFLWNLLPPFLEVGLVVPAEVRQHPAGRDLGSK